MARSSHAEAPYDRGPDLLGTIVAATQRIVEVRREAGAGGGARERARQRVAARAAFERALGAAGA